MVFLPPETPKNHSLLKWTPLSSISNSFRDINNFVLQNFPISSKLTLTSTLSRKFNTDSPYGKRLKNLRKGWSKKLNLRFENFKKHNLQKRTSQGSIFKSLRDMSNFKYRIFQCRQNYLAILPNVEPIFLPSGSSESPAHSERRRRVYFMW